MDTNKLKPLVLAGINAAAEEGVNITIIGTRGSMWHMVIAILNGYYRKIINMKPDIARIKTKPDVGSIQYLIHRMIFYTSFELTKKDISNYQQLVDKYRRGGRDGNRRNRGNRWNRQGNRHSNRRSRKLIYIKTDGGRGEYVGGFIDREVGKISNIHMRGYYLDTSDRRIYSGTGHCWPIKYNGDASDLVVIKFQLLDLLFDEPYAKTLPEILSNLPTKDVFILRCSGRDTNWKHVYRMKVGRTWSFIKHNRIKNE
jgi:hypothetical protein